MRNQEKSQEKSGNPREITTCLSEHVKVFALDLQDEGEETNSEG